MTTAEDLSINSAFLDKFNLFKYNVYPENSYGPTGTSPFSSFNLDANDLQYLFNYRYDTQPNYDYEHYLDNTDREYIPNSEDYDSALLDQLYCKKEFSTYTSGTNNYGLAEILPGYVLHVKVIGMDATSDSHTCKLTLQLGISNSTSSTDNQIL